MPTLRSLQQSFLKHLLGEPSDIIEQIHSTQHTSAEQRLGIYASGYRLRLKEALMTDFERLHFYLGDALFEQLMDGYIDKYQSHVSSLRDYSQFMSDFIKHQQPFARNPELHEIVKIEQAFNFSFDAADCEAICLEDLSSFPVDSWPFMKVNFHASVQTLDCQCNSFEIWKALSEEISPPVLQQEASCWLIWRKDGVSRYRSVNDAEMHALSLMRQGVNFSELCEGLLAFFDEEQTPIQAVGFLQNWISEKMVCQLYG